MNTFYTRQILGCFTLDLNINESVIELIVYGDICS
jgi:hypothetical protein